MDTYPNWNDYFNVYRDRLTYYLNFDKLLDFMIADDEDEVTIYCSLDDELCENNDGLNAFLSTFIIKEG